MENKCTQWKNDLYKGVRNNLRFWVAGASTSGLALVGSARSWFWDTTTQLLLTRGTLEKPTATSMNVHMLLVITYHALLLLFFSFAHPLLRTFPAVLLGI
jgi:hypothetical protein